MKMNKMNKMTYHPVYDVMKRLETCAVCKATDLGSEDTRNYCGYNICVDCYQVQMDAHDEDDQPLDKNLTYSYIKPDMDYLKKLEKSK